MNARLRRTSDEPGEIKRQFVSSQVLRADGKMGSVPLTADGLANVKRNGTQCARQEMCKQRRAFLQLILFANTPRHYNCHDLQLMLLLGLLLCPSNSTSSSTGGCDLFPRETAIQDIPKHEFSLFLRKLNAQICSCSYYSSTPERKRRVSGGMETQYVSESMICGGGEGGGWLTNAPAGH